jgi:hypothetical protein
MDIYTSKMKAPIYEIKGEKPKLSQLVDESKVEELFEKIDKSVVPHGIKNFLKIAATRHYKFDYAKIAEYYANSNVGVQELFEQSALVIIDFDKAIENGFVQMNKRLMEIRKNEPEKNEK